MAIGRCRAAVVAVVVVVVAVVAVVVVVVAVVVVMVVARKDQRVSISSIRAFSHAHAWAKFSASRSAWLASSLAFWYSASKMSDIAAVGGHAWAFR